MSSSPTQSTYIPLEDPATVSPSPSGRRRPPTLDGLSRHRPRAEDLYRRHSSSISYRKSHDRHTQFDHVNSPLASTCSQTPAPSHHRHSLQTAGRNAYVFINGSSITGDSPAPEFEGEDHLRRDDVSSTRYRRRSDMGGVSPRPADDVKLRLSKLPTPNLPPSAGAARTLSLVEQHGDLLTFIAKKERRCLDLREELQKSEEELRKLKRKWEIVIGRSLASPTMSAGTSPALPGSRFSSVLPLTAYEVGSRSQDYTSRSDALFSTSTSSEICPQVQQSFLPGSNERASSDQEGIFQRDLLHNDEPQDHHREDSISWDPLLQHIAPVSSVAKKWVGGIGKGFLDLLQDKNEAPTRTSRAPLRNRTSTADTINGVQTNAYPNVSPKHPAAPMKLLERFTNAQNDLPLSTFQRGSPAATASFITSPLSRSRNHANSSSSNSNSVIDSDADSSHRTSMSSVGPSYAHANLDHSPIKTASSRSNCAVDPFTQSPVTLLSINNASPRHSTLRPAQPTPKLAPTHFEETYSEAFSPGSGGDQTPHMSDLSDRQRLAQPKSENRITQSEYDHEPTSSSNNTSQVATELGDLDPMPSDIAHGTVVPRSDRSGHMNHQSRRSTFDFFSSATGHLTANLTKKLGDITNSETYRTSKRATMNFVGSVEKSLTDAITSDVSARIDVPSPSNLQSIARTGSFIENNELHNHVILDGRF